MTLFDTSILIAHLRGDERATRLLLETPTVERGSWSVGTYDIFVGSPTEGATVTYTLRFVE